VECTAAVDAAAEVILHAKERPDGKKILEQISNETGGRLFKVTKKETLDKIYAEIDEDLATSTASPTPPTKATPSATTKSI